MQEEVAIFGMEINWPKTKIQAVGTQHYASVVHVNGNDSRPLHIPGSANIQR